MHGLATSGVASKHHDPLNEPETLAEVCVPDEPGQCGIWAARELPESTRATWKRWRPALHGQTEQSEHPREQGSKKQHVGNVQCVKIHAFTTVQNRAAAWGTPG